MGDVVWPIAGGALGIYVAAKARSEIDLSDFWMVALSAATVLLMFGLFLRALVRTEGDREGAGSNQSLFGLIGLGVLATLVLQNVDIVADRDAFAWLIGLAAIGIAAASLAATAVKSWQSRRVSDA